MFFLGEKNRPLMQLSKGIYSGQNTRLGRNSFPEERPLKTILSGLHLDTLIPVIQQAH